MVREKQGRTRGASAYGVGFRGVVTPEEIARRKELFRQVMERRSRMEPLDISTDELLHQEREVAPKRYG